MSNRTCGTPRPDLTIDGLIHDLNNVFQTIIDAAELVGSDPTWNPIAGVIQRSVDQGRRIVSSIAEKDYGAVPFEAIAENAMVFVRDFVKSTQGPSIEFVSDIRTGIYVELKPDALERVLVNLFINATQAAQSACSKHCRIHVSARQSGGVASISVSDDGPGISGEVLPMIFAARFSTNGERSGLGLYIVHTLVAAAGGSVSASNGGSGGALFQVTLPAVAAPVKDAVASAVAGV